MSIKRMNSASKLLSALDGLDSQAISPSSPRRVTTDSNLGEWELVVDQVDALACVLASLAVCCPQLKSSSSEQLKELSTSIAERLQYLLEPIRLIECDETTMQVRSDPPSTEDDQSRCYYELLVKNNGLSLRRYQAGSGQTRRPIAMSFTREVLRRLCNDLEDAILA